MNEGKEGPHYQYTNSLISLLHRTCIPPSIPSIRRLSLRMMSIHIKKLKEVVPDFTTIWWRVARMKINLDPNINPSERDDIVIAVDSMGIKVTNRGEWILDKWKNKRIRKGFIKIHVAVDIKTIKIVSMSITKEDVHDGKMLKELVDDVSDNYSIKKVMADGAYNSKNNFRHLGEMKIIPGIKVRRNSSVKNNTKCIPRKLFVIPQLKDLKR
jgi:hypothetical protein